MRQRTVGSWIVLIGLFGSLYYAADKVLTQIEQTINDSVITDVLVPRPRVKMVQTGDVSSTGEILSGKVLGADTGNISTSDLSNINDSIIHDY